MSYSSLPWSEEKVERRQELEDEEECWEIASSGLAMAVKAMNVRQLWLPAQDLHKVRLAKILVQIGR